MRPIHRLLTIVFPGIALMLILTSPAPVAAKAYMTPDYASGTERPVKLALLPPHADFVKAKAVMSEQMVGECQALENAAAESIRRALESKGYEVRYVTVDEINATPELRDLVGRVNDRYHEEWSRIVRRPKRVRDGRYRAGDDVVELSTVLGVDGVILSRIQAVGVTVGRAMLVGIFGGFSAQPESYGRLDVSVVEGGEGKIEAYFFKAQPASLKQLVNKPDMVMHKACKKGLKKLPMAGATVDRTQIARAVTEDEEEEEDIVGEFEALLAADEPEGEDGGGS